MSAAAFGPRRSRRAAGHQKKKIKRNDFGCFNVGDACKTADVAERAAYIPTRALNAVPSRRGMLDGLAGSAFGIVNARLPGMVDAKKKRRKRKAKRNEFGCLDVGKACGGKNAKCCSGICQGKKPKKGKKDKSRCVAHDTGGC